MTMKINGRQVTEELEKDMHCLCIDLNLKQKYRYKNKYIILFLIFKQFCFLLNAEILNHCLKTLNLLGFYFVRSSQRMSVIFERLLCCSSTRSFTPFWNSSLSETGPLLQKGRCVKPLVPIVRANLLK